MRGIKQSFYKEYSSKHPTVSDLNANHKSNIVLWRNDKIIPKTVTPN